MLPSSAILDRNSHQMTEDDSDRNEVRCNRDVNVQKLIVSLNDEWRSWPVHSTKKMRCDVFLI